MLFIMVFVLLLFSSFPSLANATTRYIDSTAGACAGNYSIASRNCTGSDGTSYATIATAITAHAGGDTLYIRTGTYTENGAGNNGPFYDNLKSGALGAVTTVSSYNSEVVTIKPAACVRVMHFNGDSYITVHGLILDGRNCSFDVVKIEIGSTNIIIEDGEVTNNNLANANLKMGILGGGTTSNITIRRNHIHHIGSGGSTEGHGIYSAGSPTGWLIEANEIDHCNSYALSLYPNPIGFTERRNYIHDNGYSGGANGQVVLSNDTHIFEYNIVVSPTAVDTYAVQVQYTTPTGTKLRHNILYGRGGSIGVYIDAAASGTILQNNIILNFTTNVSNLGSSTTQTTNKTTGTITDCTSSTTVFTHKAGSSCIDAGTNIGLSYNGSAPDQGAFEVFVFTSGSVESATPTKLSVLFQNNLYPPLKPAASPGTFTARKAGASDAVTASTVTGDNQVDLTLTTAIVAGNAVDVSWASGNLTDSALIGNTLNQPYVQGLTLQSITNNTAGAPTSVLTQSVFVFHGLRGTEAAPVGTPYATAPSNTNVVVNVGGSVRLRFAVTCTTSLCAPMGFYPYYSKNAGAYTLIPDTYGADNIAFCGTSPDPDIPASGTPTTSQIGAGTFSAGAIVRTSNAIPTVTFAAVPSKTELEYCFSFSVSATAADTYDIRLRKQDTTVLDAYTVTPRATLVSPSSGSGF